MPSSIGKKILPFLCYPALGLLAGWASLAVPSSRQIGKPPAAAAEEAGDFPPLGGKHRGKDSASSSSSMPVTAEDFIRLMQERKRALETLYEDPTAGWTLEEIRAALDQATLAEMRRSPGRTQLVLRLLLQAYAGRDVEAAITWLGQQPLATAVELLNHWPEDRGKEALDFLLARPELAGRFSNFERNSFSRAMEQGVPEVIALVKKLRSGVREWWFRGFGECPPGFDFAGLLAHPDLPGRSQEPLKAYFINEWQKVDFDAAFRWVAEHEGPERLAEQVRMSGENAGSLAQRMADLPAEKRDAFFAANARELASSPGWPMSGWLAETQDTHMRDRLRETFAQGIFFGGMADMKRGLQAVESLPEVEARLELLERMTPPDDFRLREKETEDGNGTVRLRAVQEPDEEAVTALRGTLERWGVDQERAGKIISRIKQVAAAP